MKSTDAYCSPTRWPESLNTTTTISWSSLPLLWPVKLVEGKVGRLIELVVDTNTFSRWRYWSCEQDGTSRQEEGIRLRTLFPTAIEPRSRKMANLSPGLEGAPSVHEIVIGRFTVAKDLGLRIRKDELLVKTMPEPRQPDRVRRARTRQVNAA